MPYVGTFFRNKIQNFLLELTTIPPWTTPHPLCWGVRPNQIVLIPYEGDCRKYWACHGSTPELETCPVGFFFDPERQLCDFPETVDCDGHTGTPDPSTPSKNNLVFDFSFNIKFQLLL